MLNDMEIMGYSFVAEHSPGREPCHEHNKKKKEMPFRNVKTA